MNYRNFGKLDFKPSILGFGCMRLPVLPTDPTKIDETEAIAMIRYAIDNGVNYIDTAYFYHQGQSEILVGKALQDGYRQKVKLATKLPVFLCEKHADFDRYLNEQLKKLQTDQIDFYLVHGLGQATWEKSKKLDYEGFLKSALSDGRISYAGFSFHDKLPLFKEIVDAFPWTFCQIQYNYMDTEFQAGTEGLNYAVSKGLAVVVMEPIKGGKLANNPPPSVQTLWNSAEVNRTPAEWALRWVWNNPDVSLLLSGMTTKKQVDENLHLANESEPNSLTDKELSIIESVKEQYKLLTKIDCTACGYCHDCPSGVDVPKNFQMYNEAHTYDSFAGTRFEYKLFLKPESRASACIECGVCEDVCPQQINIRKHLKEVKKVFED